MYVRGNPRTKKALREMIARDERVTLFAPGLGEPVENGVETVEGPHYPQPHRWYARVQVVDGVVVRVVQ